ncbi:Translational repressor [Rhodotorula kratochvilovae]
MSSPTDTTKPAPGLTSTSSTKKDDSPVGNVKKAGTSSAPGSPARPRQQQGSNRRRSTSRGADNNGDASPTGERKPQQQGGQRQGSGGGGQQHGRRASRGGGQQGGQRRGSGGAQSGQQQQQQKGAQTSESLSNLKNLISDMREGGPAAPNQGSPSSSPARTRGPAHRKSASSGPVPPSISAPPPTQQLNTAPLGASTLNPNAGGFHPGSLGVINDMNEGLVTPTASRFDLMTNQPYSPPLGGAHPAELASFGGAAALNQRAFAFPQSPQQQQAQAQAQAQALALQQQQFQLAQLAAGMSPAGLALGAGNEASELIAEQLAIQQQLATLKLQQESLMARFGDMQASLLHQPPAQLPPPSGPSGQHRRVSSASAGPGGAAGHQRQPSGAMGQFTFPAPVAGGESPSQLPKGHGRRHSVQTGAKGSPSGVGATPPGAGAGAPFGGFQFPPRAPAQGTPQRFGGGGFEDEYGSGADSPSQGRQMGHQRRQSGSVSSLGGWSMNVNQSGTANLAEAQAHLQALGAYRASAGHGRVPSFGMSAIGPGGQGGPGQLAMAGYGGGIPQPGMGGGNNGPQMRKTLFAPYLPQASIPPLLAAGKLVIGTLRVNKRNRSDAYVATDVLESDIYICGSKDRNRALEGDVVAIELLDVDDVWGTKKDKEEKKRKKEEQASFDPRTARDLRKQDKKKDDVEVEGQGLLLFEDEEVTDEQKPQFAGHVVAVLERAPGQLFSGTLGVLRPSSAATQQKQDAERREREGVDLRGGQNNNNNRQQPPKIIWFRPTDKRVPLIAIPTEQAPADFVDNADKYQDRLFVACIKRWPITSLHPFGQLVEELGPIGDIETETNALLKDCNFSAEDFADSVNKCLPPTPWSIPERETQPDVRRDLRQHRVFTIDPETAKDLDDALHVVQNDDGTFEVGVHIADVSHFVKPNTPLDREARKRATTVYLVQRAVPMLPPTLSEELCSLNAGADKLTFSVIFTMTPEGQVVSTWFGKTIINSKVKLAYSDAQSVIDTGALPEGKIPDDAALREGVESDVKMLAGIAKHLRHRRFENGALRIDNVKVSFALDEFGLPVDAHEYVRKEANELIEEFMLLANISVAGKIASGLPDQALLRRHESPIDRRLEAFVSRMKRLGIELDSSSSGALMASIAQVTDPEERLTLQHLSTRSMLRAQYFCTGMLDISKYGHYALNVPLYTHFTSPIRRYADVMVHRQLEAVLAAQAAGTPLDARFPLDAESVGKVAQTCNIKKDAARQAQEQSQHLFLCVLIDDLTKRYGPVVRYGTVIGVLDQAFDVLVSEFGVEKRVHVDQMPTESTVHDERENTLQIFWKKGVDVLSWLAETNQDEHLQRLRSVAKHHSSLMEADSGKGAAEQALFDDDDDDDDEGDEKPADGNGRDKRVFETDQHRKSRERIPLKFEGLSTENGHAAQTVKTLDRVPVVISADCSKSPPIIRVHAVSPFA